jgi:cytochrome c-type biogenesis protein CcmH
MRPRAKLVAAALGGLLCLAAASDPAERLHDPAKEARARTLFRQIRCVVCQSQSIDDSDAELAHDLRQAVREQVAAGRSDAEIKRYLTARYGEFVLMRPRFSWDNAALWLTPVLALLGGGVVLVVRARRRAGAPESEAQLSPHEEAELQRLLDRHGFAATSPHENTQDDLSVS